MWIDSHAHLDMPEFEDDRDVVVERARQKKVQSIVTVGVDVKSSSDAVELANTIPGLYAAVGMHPHEANQFSKQVLEDIALLSENKKVVAWGEIGLDFFKYYAPRDAQVRAFEAQLRQAVDLGLPVIIHDRDAHQDMIRILRKFGKRDRFGVVHCFSGDMALADELFALGFFVSIPGTVTYKKASLVREVASKAPLEKILIETDAPFLAPVPFRGKRNEPAFVAVTGRQIAKLRRMPEDKFAEATTNNAKYLFGI